MILLAFSFGSFIVGIIVGVILVVLICVILIKVLDDDVSLDTPSSHRQYLSNQERNRMNNKQDVTESFYHK